MKKFFGFGLMVARDLAVFCGAFVLTAALGYLVIAVERALVQAG